MKTLIARTAVDCISVSIKERDLSEIGEERVLFLNLYEAQNLVDTLLIALMLSEQEALDMLPEVPKACSGFVGKFGIECDKCSRYQDDCSGTGEFNVI